MLVRPGVLPVDISRKYTMWRQEMLRVFGSYSFERKVKEETKNEMKSLFILDRNLVDYSEVNKGPLFFIYEYVKFSGSEEHYWNDDNKNIICLVIGSIYARGDKSFTGSQRSNVAKWFVEEYEKERSFSFVKELRGIFNILFFEKGELFLINDILGLSPMFISEEKNSILFCNEAEPIIRIRKKNLIDRKSVIDFHIYGFVPQGRSFIYGLRNQKEASIIRIKDQKKEESCYGFIKPFNLKGLGRDEKLKIIHDTFQDAVAIRASQKEVVIDLTGGWDTRYILANLLKLNKKIVAVTEELDPKDFAIASLLVKKFGLKHVIVRRQKREDIAMKDFLYRFSSQGSRYKFRKSSFHSKVLENMSIPRDVVFRRFTGLFGTELLGYIFQSLLKSYDMNYLETAKNIFSNVFLSKAESKESLNSFLDRYLPVFCFPKKNIYRYTAVSQIGRSYLNIHDGRCWERPTFQFGFLRRVPFADSKFFALMSSLDESYFNYGVYYELYRKYYSEFLEIPWIRDHRLRNTSSEANLFELTLDQLKKDTGFMRFITNKKVFKPSSMGSFENFKTRYYFYTWFRENRPFLKESNELI